MRHRHWLVSAAVILLVIYAGRKVDWRAAATLFSTAAIAPLVAATLINIASLMLTGVRWWIFLRQIGVERLSLAMRGVTVGAGLNNLLVANGGDAARALLVARAAGVRRTHVLATLALDRIFDPLCFGLLLFVATFVMRLPAPLSRVRPIAGIALAAVLGLLAMLIKTPARVADAVDGLEGWRERAHEFRRQLQFLATARRFVVAMLISLSVWGLQMATFALVAKSVGVAMPLAGTLAALLLTNAGLVLRATPGNVGYFQFAYVVASARFGVPTEAAVAAGLLIQLVQIVPVTLMALTLAPRMYRTNGEARSATDSSRGE